MVALEIALLLPVRVSVACRVPDAVRAGVLQLPVTPVGSPVTWNVELVAGLAVPIGVIVATRCCVPVELMASVAGESASETAGAISTCTALVVCAFNPSPDALICSVPEVTVAVAAALSVRVDTVLFAPVLEKVAGLQDAVTPTGIPITARATDPENEPPVDVVTCSVAVLP